MPETQAGGRRSLSALAHAAIEEIDRAPNGLSRLERLLIAAVAEIGGRDDDGPPAIDLLRFTELTAREGEVLALIVGGHTNSSAAAVLGISSRTVEVHRLRVQRKLGVRGAAELVKIAIEVPAPSGIADLRPTTTPAPTPPR